VVDREALVVDRKALVVDREALVVDREALVVDHEALAVDSICNADIKKLPVCICRIKTFCALCAFVVKKGEEFI
jgi:hypothetical protein